MSGERWTGLMDAFHDAAIDGSGWYSALQGLAEATGSRCGQLLGLGTGDAEAFEGEAFNLITGFDSERADGLTAAGVNDPATNPRVRAGMAVPVLEVLTESDFIDADTHRRHPHYREFARPLDIPFICLTPLVRGQGMMVGLAVLRSASQGHIAPAERAVFRAAAPMVRAAVRTQMALEHDGSAFLTGALEALSMTAFLCDGRGTVCALTPAAEQLVGSAGALQLRNGKLTLPDSTETSKLNAAILAAAEPSGSRRQLIRTLVCRGVDGSLPLVLDVIALPARDHGLTVAPRVLVTTGRPERAHDATAAALRTAYGLTAAEADIALHLTAGRSPRAIADERRVAVGTVRAQIKTLLAKLGVKRQAELVARLGRLR